MKNSYHICSRCVMDTSDPEIVFDDEGVCNHCHSYDTQASSIVIKAESGESQPELDKLIAEIKYSGKNRDYDCVIGLSGGVDSSYVALKVKEAGLRPLAVHFDSGWNSELAVNNIENIVKKLDIDLFTFVCDWDEMRDLQLAFFKSGVANCDTPTDHAFLAVLYRVAAKFNIRYIVTGTNYATEFILPSAWGYSPADLTHLKAIHKQFGRRQLVNYPTLGFFKRYFYYPIFKGIKTVRILNLMPYNKMKVKSEIMEALGWRDYGGKHYESIFTRFFQAYYLPEKFGFDKRKAHLSSLIVSGQISREDALIELSSPTYPSEKLAEDKEFVAKKLGISVEEFDVLLTMPQKSYKDYPTEEWLFSIKNLARSIINKITGIKTARP